MTNAKMKRRPVGRFWWIARNKEAHGTGVQANQYVLSAMQPELTVYEGSVSVGSDDPSCAVPADVWERLGLPIIAPGETPHRVRIAVLVEIAD